MITENFLDNATNNLESLMQDLSNKTIQDIARRISKTIQQGEPGITPTAQYQMMKLDEMQGFSRDMVERIAALTELALPEIDRLIIEAAQQSHSYDMARFANIGRVIPPLEQNARYKQIERAVSEQTKGEFVNITRTTGFKGLEVRKYFTQTLDRAVLQVSSGLFDYNTVIRSTVKEMTESGLQAVRYGQRNLNVVTAVRNNVLTACRQIADEVALTNGESLGLELVETTAHATARPEHIPWQGKRFKFNSYDEIRRAKQI